jgi:hypothetical protein
VVSENLARTFRPNESAVGKFIDYEWHTLQHVEIVGWQRTCTTKEWTSSR